MVSIYYECMSQQAEATYLKNMAVIEMSPHMMPLYMYVEQK